MKKRTFQKRLRRNGVRKERAREEQRKKDEEGKCSVWRGGRLKVEVWWATTGKTRGKGAEGKGTEGRGK